MSRAAIAFTALVLLGVQAELVAAQPAHTRKVFFDTTPARVGVYLGVTEKNLRTSATVEAPGTLIGWSDKPVLVLKEWFHGPNSRKPIPRSFVFSLPGRTAVSQSIDWEQLSDEGHVRPFSGGTFVLAPISLKAKLEDFSHTFGGLLLALGALGGCAFLGLTVWFLANRAQSRSALRLRADADAAGAQVEFDQRQLTHSLQRLGGVLPSGKDRFDLLGRYYVLRPISVGGMGVVYLGCRDDAVNESGLVALKQIRADHLTDEARSVFLREAERGKELQHPNAMRVIGLEKQHDEPYLILEYVNGHTLAELLESDWSSGLPISRALEIIKPICEVLALAHGKDIVHRDIKPSNVMLSREGVIKVMDFGLARRTGAKETKFQTTDGAKGTQEYAPPECLNYGDEFLPVGDQYSTGILLFELITGVWPPYERGLDTQRGIVTFSRPSLLQYRSDLPPDFVAALHRMIATDPADRFPTIMDAYAALLKSATRLSI